MEIIDIFNAVKWGIIDNPVDILANWPFKMWSLTMVTFRILGLVTFLCR